MAPEQTLGRPLTPAADIWGLGAILYELLTGSVPAGNGKPVPPSASNPAADDGLSRICLGCLGHETAERYASVAELVEELGCYLQQQTEAPK
jgi:serine/threonine-protein kinase